MLRQSGGGGSSGQVDRSVVTTLRIATDPNARKQITDFRDMAVNAFKDIDRAVAGVGRATFKPIEDGYRSMTRTVEQETRKQERAVTQYRRNEVREAEKAARDMERIRQQEARADAMIQRQINREREAGWRQASQWVSQQQVVPGSPSAPATIESQVRNLNQLRTGARQSIEGITQLGRAMILLGVATEEDKRKALEMWAAFEAGAQGIKGLINLWQGATAAAAAYNSMAKAGALASFATMGGAGLLAGGALAIGATVGAGFMSERNRVAAEAKQRAEAKAAREQYLYDEDQYNAYTGQDIQDRFKQSQAFTRYSRMNPRNLDGQMSLLSSQAGENYATYERQLDNAAGDTRNGYFESSESRIKDSEIAFAAWKSQMQQIADLAIRKGEKELALYKEQAQFVDDIAMKEKQRWEEAQQRLMSASERFALKSPHEQQRAIQIQERIRNGSATNDEIREGQSFGLQTTNRAASDLLNQRNEVNPLFRQFINEEQNYVTRLGNSYDKAAAQAESAAGFVAEIQLNGSLQVEANRIVDLIDVRVNEAIKRASERRRQNEAQQKDGASVGHQVAK